MIGLNVCLRRFKGFGYSELVASAYLDAIAIPKVLDFISIQINGFSDASENAYASIIYLCVDC